MAKRYTSTVQVNCIKQHICAGCGTRYSYKLSRKAVGTAGTPAKAQVAMQKRVQQITDNETDMHPCPACGLYQYDMIAQRRAKSRIQFFAIALVAFATVLILRACYVLQSTTLTWIAVAIGAFVVLAQMLLETQNKNSDLAKNQALGQDRVAAGTLQLSAAETAVQSSETLARPSRGLLHLLALLMLLLSVPFLLMPTLMCFVHRWPVNNACYPPVLGPTDQTRIYLPDAITSVKGYWRGNPTASFHYAGGPAGGQQVTAVANQNDWGSTINDVKSSEQAETSHPWVEVMMPDNAALAGKTVTCDIDLNLEYPQMQQGGSTFQTISDERSDRVSIQLAPPGAGQLYNSAWWTCTAGGGGAITLACLMLYYRAKAFGRLAKPTQVFPIQAVDA